MKKRMGEKGNVFAFIIIAIIVLAFILMLSRHQPQVIPKDINTESKVESITRTNIIRSLRQGIQNFAMHGYSTLSPAWVCNSFQPPLANEVDTNFESYLFEDLNKVAFEVLKQELGYEFNDNFEVKLELQTSGGIKAQLNKMLSLDNGKVDIWTNFVTVKTESREEERKLSKSYALSFEYRQWLMYKKYVEWGTQHLPALGEDICNILTKSHPCQINACGDGSQGILIKKTEFDIDSLNLDPAIDKQLLYLNSIMNPEGIVCEVQKGPVSKEFVVARKQKCDECTAPQLIYRNRKACAAYEPLGGLACRVREPIGPIVLPLGGPPKFEKLVNCPSDMNKQEAVSSNSWVEFNFQFICYDKKKSLPGPTKIEDSASRIEIILSIARTCSPDFIDMP